MNTANNLKFNLYDGTHFFDSASKDEALKFLTGLLEKSQNSLKAWEENPDNYLTREENKKEIAIRKKAISYLRKCLNRVKTGPECLWTLHYMSPSLMFFRVSKKGASQ